MRFVAIQSVDTWHFGDSTPFAEIVAERTTVFPPSPATVVGAIRAALARSQGWDGVGRWPRDLDAVLGDGPDDLGSLRFAGPFLSHQGAVVVPLPRHVLGESAPDGTWRANQFVGPGSEVSCDLGRVRLPANTSPDMAPANDRWIHVCDLVGILTSVLPESDRLLRREDIWHQETRVGISRDPDTHTVEQGALFATAHVRLMPEVALMVGVNGLPEDWDFPEGLWPVGGEGRMGYLEEADGDLFDVELVVDTDEICASRRLLLVALTPLCISADVLRGTAPIPGTAGATVVSACVTSPVRYGGWSSVAGGPQPLRNHCAAGTTLFCYADDPVATLDEISAGATLARVGDRQEEGCGVVAVAPWHEEEG